jgi:SP family sugar:H+ symporter-like MFS transporter
VYFIVPEMKGFTIEQLDCLYDHGMPTLESKGFQFESQVIDGESISIVDKSVASLAVAKKTAE